MNDLPPSSSFTQAAQPTDNLAIAADILAWFKARGAGWQQEIEGVLDFYIDSVEHPASDPDAFEPGEKGEASARPSGKPTGRRDGWKERGLAGEKVC
jgi:hypothetical protein